MTFGIKKTLCLAVASLFVTVISAPSTNTRDVSSTCTTGTPATQQHPAFPINDYTFVGPAADWTSYSVDQAWYNEHFISGPHYIAGSVASDPYGAFKCQYICNAAGNCSSFFVWHVNAGTLDEHTNCVLFDAVMEPSVFEQSNSTMGAGGYDKLCRTVTRE